MIYLITVNYHSTELIKALLASVQATAKADYQAVIVNNSLADRQIHTLASDSVYVLEAGRNLGFGGGCNLGLQWVYARDKAGIVWLINPDTRLHPDALPNALEFCATHPELAIVGTVVLQPDGSVWFAGGEFNSANGRIVAIETLPNYDRDYFETPWVTGCSLLLNLQDFSECPQFDPDYFLYYEDFDFCRRYAGQGHLVVLTPRIQVIHHPSSITNRDPPLKLQHSTYSYLLALEKHTPPPVVLYRFCRIVLYALRVGMVEPEKAIAIIKGVFRYVVRVSRFAKFNHR